jgi:membrane protease YdiL (CAAX protease family)
MSVIQPISQGKTDSRAATGRELLTAVGSSIGLAAFFGILTGVVLRPIVPAFSDVDWLATVIWTEVQLAFIVGHLIAFGGLEGLKQKLRLRSNPWPHVGLAFLVWLSIWLILIVVYVVLSPTWGVVKDMSDAVLKIGSLYGRLDGATPAMFALGMLQSIVLAPLMEEFLFRGSLFGWLRQKTSSNLTILITAILFAGFHPLVLLWPMAFLLGLGAGWIRERTQSLTPFLIMHVINSVAMITAAYFITGWRVQV